MNNNIFKYLKKDENYEKKTLPRIVEKSDLAFYNTEDFGNVWIHHEIKIKC